MKIVSEFGIDPIHLLAQVVNFLVLLYILKRFLYKPVLAVLKKREVKIREGLEAAQKGEEMLVKARTEEKSILSKAGEEAKIMIEETKQQAEKMENEILEKARLDSEVMLSRSREQIEQERAESEKAVEKKLAVSTVSVLEKILPKVLTKNDHMRIIEESQELLRKALVA